MAWLTTLLRRSLWIVAIGSAGGLAYSWWRDRTQPGAAAPPEWPPLQPEADIAPGATGATDTTDTTDVGISTVEVGAGIAADDRSGTSAGPSADTASVDTASVVNALVDTPDARSVGGDDAPWVAPLEDGSCPDGYPIKANDNSGIFHVPGGRFYDRTKPERCYADAESAVADGYRQAKQ